MAKVRKEVVFKAIADSLTEFGYRGVDGKLVEEVHTAMSEGKTNFALPHGVVGQFAEKQIVEAMELGLLDPFESDAYARAIGEVE